MADGNEVLEEALNRLHRTGPEWSGRLSNHGPMVVEAMIRHGHADGVERWLDWYETRLDAVPTTSRRIQAEEWVDALGDPSRLGDWADVFDNELAEHRWLDVLEIWWPRLLPGLAASATHSVIRVGHALAYWAGRWLPIPNTPHPSGNLEIAQALESLPALGDKQSPFPGLLTMLGSDPRWPDAAAALKPNSIPGAARDQLVALVTAATAMDVYSWTTNPDALAAVRRAAALIQEG